MKSLLILPALEFFNTIGYRRNDGGRRIFMTACNKSISDLGSQKTRTVPLGAWLQSLNVNSNCRLLTLAKPGTRILTAGVHLQRR